MANLLEGVRVVEMGTHVAVPKAARLLAEWGADVIKVENPVPDPYRYVIPSLYQVPVEDGNAPIWECENSNKRDICLNLKDPGAMEVMHRLLSQADIFLCNTRPRSLAKMGLDYDSLKEKYPRLICAYFSGFGEEGPDKDRPGFDIAAFWARCGALTEWPYDEAGPFKPTPGFGDGATGSMLLAGVLAALYHREKTGRGERVSTSLFGTAIWYQSTALVRGQEQWCTQKLPLSRTHILPFNPLYKTKDGQWFMMSVTKWSTEVPAILRVLGLEQYIDDPRFASTKDALPHSEELIAILDKRFAELEADYVEKALTSVDAVFSRLSTIYELSQDEQALANGYIYEQTLRSGNKVVLPSTPVHFESSPDLPRNYAPLLGEHTAQIMSELGYGDEEIQQMAENKAVVCYEKK